MIGREFDLSVVAAASRLNGSVLVDAADDWLAPTAFLAHTCTIVGAVPEADKLYQSLSTTSSSVVRVGPLAGWLGPVDHHSGSLARLLGRPEEAKARLLRALALEKRMAARPFAARTQAELARVLAASNPARAQKMAEQALALVACRRCRGDRKRSARRHRRLGRQLRSTAADT